MIEYWLRNRLADRLYQVKMNNSLLISSLPTPKLPPIDVPLLQSVLVDALIIAVVSLTIDVSLGRIWAREKGYQISANQEFFALGFANIFGSFFGAFPVGASVPRSSLVFSCGGRSQVRWQATERVYGL